MRIIKKMIIAFTILVVPINIVNAASKCSNEKVAELNREVANIDAYYEALEKIPDLNEVAPPDSWDESMGLDALPKRTYLKVNVTNLSENFYVEITNNVYSDEVRTLRLSDSVDGVASFDWENLSQVTRLTIKVLTTDATGCGGESFRTIYLTLPRYNDYSGYSMCSQVPDYYMCQKLVDWEERENYDFGTFMTEINNEIEKKNEEVIKQEEENKNWFEKTIDFIKDHKVWFIVGGTVVIVGAGVTTFMIIRKRRRDEI